MSKEPEGFTPLSVKQLEQETGAVLGHEHKDKNVRSSATGYIVREDVRRRPFADNSSIQSVEYKVNGYAILSTEKFGAIGSLGAQESTSLIASSDGSVFLTGEKNGTDFSLDITRAAAEVGITAAGIRRTQQDIAADAQVSRPEQQQIINTIAKAKTLTPDR